MTKGLRRQRVTLLVWALVLVGLPLAIVTQLVLGPENYGAPSGSQPGGKLEVRVVDEGDDPLVDHPVEFQLWRSGGLPETAVTLRSNREGRVVYDAPALEGKYRILAGGGDLQRVGRERSFVDDKGRPVELKEVELTLRPAAVLELTLTRTEDLSPASGEVTIVGKAKGGALFGLLGAPIKAGEPFADGYCELDGLPPFSGEVQVRFKDGAELRFTVDAGAGRTALAYEL